MLTCRGARVRAWQTVCRAFACRPAAQMFEMDAYVGVEVLGLMFMKGEQPHAGFPEVKYADMAERLARAGYRVVVVEQVRTLETF
jgi:DNA mismatch repair ATPase MutS